MKRFIIQSLIFSVLIIGSLALGYLLTPVNKDSYLYAYTAKKAMLDSITERKIVFIGGSNLAFSLRSDMIADSFDIAVANTGLHAGVGLRFMLDDTDPYLHSGDIAVISPEYQQLISCMDGLSDDGLVQVLSIDGLDKLPTLTIGQWSVFLAGIPAYIFNSIRYRTKTKDPIYASDTFNRYGDHISHYSLPRKANVKGLSGPTNVNVDWCVYLSDKIKSWRARGVEVLLIPPVTIQDNYDVNTVGIQQMYSVMDSLGTPFAVPAIQHVMPDTMSFDTPYHMTKEGATIFTGKVIDELRPVI